MSPTHGGMAALAVVLTLVSVVKGGQPPASGQAATAQTAEIFVSPQGTTSGFCTLQPGGRR